MVWDFYDGIRTGIADYRHKPHYFSCLVDSHTGTYTNRFELKPISSELLNLAMEQWKIYCNWENEYRSGKLTSSTHPGHGHHSKKYNELEIIIKNKIAILPSLANQFIAQFDFKTIGPPQNTGVDWAIAS